VAIVSPKELDKWIGQVIEVIYEDQSGKITQRRIKVHGYKEDLLRATCLATGRPRVFRAAGILAWSQAKSYHAG
jgi:predicted DNA-binding transcriptional regulator YafY